MYGKEKDRSKEIERETEREEERRKEAENSEKKMFCKELRLFIEKLKFCLIYRTNLIF